MSDIKPGDKVVLKSGGPNMTVEAISETTEYAVCTWFNEKNEYRQMNFNLVSLELARPPSYG
jgi:uncharacterized protein YodC (DUF2158 family)